MGNVHCSKPGCCCRLLGRPPPPLICGAACYGCTKCCMLPPERHIMFVGRTNSGKTHILYRLLGASNPKPEPTKGYTSTIRYDETNTQSFEFFDCGGTDPERPFWKTLYTNVAFNDVVYFIDPLEYRSNKEKLVEDRTEIHTLLAEPELQESQFIIYFNWKKIVVDAKDAELKKEEKAAIEKEILQDLELTGFRDYVREVIDPNVKVGHGDIEAAQNEKKRIAEMEKLGIEKTRLKREAALAAKQNDDKQKALVAGSKAAANGGKDAKSDGKAATKGDAKGDKKADAAAGKKKAEVGKIVPLLKLEHAVVIPISNEDQLFVNLGIVVKAKAETRDADDELADLI